MPTTMAATSTANHFSILIDSLLERYLQLLDQYTTLRAELVTAQSAIHQNIARANFSADRGVRYGQDFYDERVRATRLCRVTMVGLEGMGSVAGTSTPKFTLSEEKQAMNKEGDGDAHSSEKSEDGLGTTMGGNKGHCAATTTMLSEEGLPSDEGARRDGKLHGRAKSRTMDSVADDTAGKLRLEEEDKATNVGTTKNVAEAEDDVEQTVKPGDVPAKLEFEETRSDSGISRDPIRMFGLFSPPTLRAAQNVAVEMVEDIIPRLVSIDAEMQETEIAIRRGRKHRAKAEAESKKAEGLNRIDIRPEDVVALGS